MELRRIFLAGFLIMLVWVVWGAFFTPQPKNSSSGNQDYSDQTEVSHEDKEFSQQNTTSNKLNDASIIADKDPIVFTVKSDLFTAELSNELGGTFLQYTLNGDKYSGSYTNKSAAFEQDTRHSYDESGKISFLFTEEEGYNPCNPCLKGVDPTNDYRVFINENEIKNGDLHSVKDRAVIKFMSSSGEFVHTITIERDSYMVMHKYELNEGLGSMPKVLVWANGTRPSEKYGWLDDQNSYGMFLTKNSNDSDYLTGNSNVGEDALKFSEDIEWVASRNKYFVSAIAPKQGSEVLSGRVVPGSGSPFADTYKYRGSNASVYDLELEFKNQNNFEFYSFMAPLEYSLISNSDIEGLDDIMTMGGSILRPISKVILSMTNFLNNTVPFGGYALVLILFALIVRIVAGPLTKLSLESTRKMQEVQPKIKEIQDKYKDNPKKLQSKIMETYKNHNVNPLSGCFLMLLQWPIMIPPFILFRSIIELRGEPLFLWIQDLSLPDYMFELPFHVPLLGIGNGYTGIGLLPILMGITLYLTMKQSSGSMPQQNKAMLYTMNGMFVLLFNSFPAGLNLYYVVYNILNYLQQRKTNQTKK